MTADAAARGDSGRPNDVKLRELDAPAEHAAAARLFGTVWYTDGTIPVEAHLLTAIHAAGGYVAGAYAGGAIVGASLGFLGRHHDELVLHSHMTAMLPGHEHRGVGARLKLHQRAWARDHGLDAVVWTFDPLVRRNAWFNLAKLSATIVGYAIDFYGSSVDAINRDDETDRVFVRWPTHEPERRESVRPASAAVALDVDGVIREFDPTEPFTVATPHDIVALRASQPDLARRWRIGVRNTLGSAVQRGAVARSISRDGLYLVETEGRAQ